jgi:bifunctional non-homologous end joining protein LigD
MPDIRSPAQPQRPFASLLVGEIKDGKLIFRGHVGTGYSEATLSIVGDKLKERRCRSSMCRANT